MTRITATRSERTKAYCKLAFFISFLLLSLLFFFSSSKELQHLNRAWQDYLGESFSHFRISYALISREILTRTC